MLQAISEIGGGNSLPVAALIRRLLFCVLVGAAFTFSGGAFASDKRVALVIGNSDYEFVSNLANPENDAEDVAKALTRIGFEVTSGVNLDYREMRLAVRDFAEAAEDADMVFVYFAGHGVEIDKTNYLIPVNAELRSDRDVEFEAIRLDAVVSAIANTPALKVVLVDACRNNPFLTDMIRTSATRSVGQGLGRIDPGGVLVGYSARGGTLALDGDGRNSPYAEALLDHIEEPGLEIGKMFRRIRDSVYRSTNGYQEPFTYGSLPGEDIFLVPQKVALQAPVQSTTREFAAKMASDFAVTDRLGTVEGWTDFLEKYEAQANNPLVALAAQKKSDLVEKYQPQSNVGKPSEVLESAFSLEEELLHYAAAERINTPRAWALYFDNFGVAGRLRSNAIVREERALIDDIRARVFGRYRTIKDGEQITNEMRTTGLALLDLPENRARRLQLTLSQRGNELGKADGKIGPRTIRALQSVQRAKDLPVTGLPTRATLDELSQFDVQLKGSDLFPTSGAIAKVMEAETADVLENDPRLKKVLIAFRGKQLIYGYFEDSLYVAVHLGTTVGEADLKLFEEQAGATLVEFDSPEEEDFVFEMVRHDQKLWTAGNARFRSDYGPSIGLSWSKASGWRWRSGKPLTYENWAKSRPGGFQGDTAYGRLVPAGEIQTNAVNLARTGWGGAEMLFSTVVLEIP